MSTKFALPKIPSATQTSIKVQREPDDDDPTVYTRMTEAKTLSGVHGAGPFLFDVRKEKNRKLTNELILGSVSQGVDFFIIIEEQQKFYFKAASKDLKVFLNDVAIAHGSCSPELQDGDLILAEKAKYIVNSRSDYSIDDARKHIAQRLLHSTVYAQAQIMQQAGERYEQLRKELEIEKSHLRQWEELKSEKNGLKEKIIQLQTRLHEIEKMDLEAHINEHSEKAKKIKALAEVEHQQYQQSKEKIEKQKELDQLKKAREVIDTKKQIEMEERELEKKMKELQEKKKRLKTA